MQRKRVYIPLRDSNDPYFVKRRKEIDEEIKRNSMCEEQNIEEGNATIKRIIGKPDAGTVAAMMGCGLEPMEDMKKNPANKVNEEITNEYVERWYKTVGPSKHICESDVRNAFKAGIKCRDEQVRHYIQSCIADAQEIGYDDIIGLFELMLKQLGL